MIMILILIITIIIVHFIFYFITKGFFFKKKLPLVFLLHFFDMVYTVDNDNHLICCAINV